MTEIFESSAEMKALVTALGGQGALVPTFLSAMLSIMALMVLAYVVQALGRLRSEESNGHLENLLATRFSRLSWLGLHAATALVGGAVMLALMGAVLAVLVNTTSDFSVNMGEYVLAALSYWPLLAAFAGGYIVLFGILPRAAGVVAWVYFGFVLFMSWLAPVLGLPQWIMNLSPIEHMAAPPAEDIVWRPLIIIASVALGLLVLGCIAWRNRNLLER